MGRKGYRELLAWQEGNKLALAVYKIACSFPRQHFSLASQMQRAALSVPANIVEGYSRATKKDRKRFFNQALSSLAELEYYIDFCHDLKLLNDIKYRKLSEGQIQTAKLLTGLYKSIKV